MKRHLALLFALSCFFGTTCQPKSFIPVSAAWPIHIITAANLVGYVAAFLGKKKAYENLRKTLLNQLSNEISSDAQQIQQDTSDLVDRIKNATHQELVDFATQIIGQRKANERMYGEYILAKQIGVERNESEKAAISQYQQQVKRIFELEKLQPQLGMALLGTGTLSGFTILRQVNFLE